MSRTDLNQTQSIDGPKRTTIVYINQGNRVSKDYTSYSRNWKWYRVRRGYSTPNYFENLAKGLFNPPNNFLYTTREEKSNEGIIQYLSGSTWSTKTLVTITGVFNTLMEYEPDDFSSAVLLNLDNQVILKLREKIKDSVTRSDEDGSQFNLAVFGAESPESFRMIRDNLIKIRRAYSASRRGYFKKAALILGLEHVVLSKNMSKLYRKDRSQAISDFWLEVQFGWRPLVQDISGAIGYIDKHIRRKSDNGLFRFEARGSTSSSRTIVSGDTTYSFTSRVDKKIVCYYRRSSDVFRTASSLGLTNPFYVGWELIPLSFLLDYAVRVGSWLSQFDSTLGWEFYSGTSTGFKEAMVKKVTVINRGKDSTYDWYKANIEGHTKVLECTRVGLAHTPIAILPAFKNPLSYTHAANAAALLVSNLKRK